MRLQVYALLFVLGNGCATTAVQAQLRTANALALGVNRVLPLLESAYRAEGLEAIDAARSQQDANRRLSHVRERWRPVWGLCTADDSGGPGHRCHDGAWPALVAAQGAWATALEKQIAGEPIDRVQLDQLFRQIRGAYCDLKSVLPSGVALAPAIASGCNGAP